MNTAILKAFESLRNHLGHRESPGAGARRNGLEPLKISEADFLGDPTRYMKYARDSGQVIVRSEEGSVSAVFGSSGIRVEFEVSEDEAETEDTEGRSTTWLD